MLKQSRPARAMRATGIGTVVCGAIGFACAAWASQSPRAIAASSNPGRFVDATLRIDVGESKGQNIRIINPLGRSFEIADDAAPAPWRASLTASDANDGALALSGSVRQGDVVIARPLMVVRPNTPFSMSIDGAAGTPSFHLEGTVALVDHEPSAGAEPAPVPAVKASADGDVTYRSMSPPEYPEAAVKSRAEAEVFVKVAVASDGSVTAARVDHVKSAAAPAAVAALGASAVTAIKAWRFNPARSGGRPVASDVTVPIVFSLGGDVEAAPQAEGEVGMLDAIRVSHDGAAG